MEYLLNDQHEAEMWKAAVIRMTWLPTSQSLNLNGFGISPAAFLCVLYINIPQLEKSFSALLRGIQV